jgi:hypothetical protein
MIVSKSKKERYMQHLYGISGQEEYLALKMLNKQTPDNFDDDGCNEDTDLMENFNETSYLEDCAFSTYGDLEGESW